MRPRQATLEDIEAWLWLAAEVEHLFGPMVDDPGFTEALRGAVEKGEALLLENGSGRLAGAVAVNREANAVSWLAVALDARGHGHGRRLLEAALLLLNQYETISVQTFGLGVEEGVPARHLYHSLGFTDGPDSGLAPSGVPTVLMHLLPPSSPERCI